MEDWINAVWSDKCRFTIKHIWDVDATEELHCGCAADDLQQLCDAVLSTWTEISKECFQHLLESVPQIIKQCLRKRGLTQYSHGLPNKM